MQVFAKTKIPVLDPLADGFLHTADDFTSAIVLDPVTGKELYRWQQDKLWPAASLTKLMTALVFLDTQPTWNKKVKMVRQDEVGGGRLRVRVGTTISVKDLFYASIVGSANNTTMTLARQTGLSQKKFVDRMNARAKKLGLTQTHFYEPTGMNPKNVTTASEMSQLALAAFMKKEIGAAASTEEYQIKPRGSRVTHTIRNTNHLMSEAPELDILGGKTGYLENSMYNFATLVKPVAPNDGPGLLIVVLGSKTKDKSFTSARALANWAYKAYSW